MKVLVLKMKVKEIEEIENESRKSSYERVRLCTRTPGGKSSD